jgi:histidine triad (HIT) family protein
MTNDTIFHKIVRGDIPTTKVYEDENFLAFLDIMPVALGHTLLIPKKHYTWIQDMPDQEYADFFLKAKEMIKKIKLGLSCDYVQMSVIGDEVPYVHIHLIPRFKNDGIKEMERKKYEVEQAEEFAGKIKSA